MKKIQILPSIILAVLLVQAVWFYISRFEVVQTEATSNKLLLNVSATRVKILDRQVRIEDKLSSESKLVDAQPKTMEEPVPADDLSEPIETQPYPYYNSLNVVAFREYYIDALKPLKIDPTSDVTAEEEPFTLTFRDHQNAQGFGSFFNMVMMAFQFSQEVGRQFHINTETFAYGKWTDYFVDILSKEITTSDGLVTTIGLVQPSLNSLQADFSHLHFDIETEGESYRIVETDVPRVKRLGCQQSGPSFTPSIEVDYNRKVFKLIGMENFVEIRRTLAQAIWEPKPEIRKEIRDLRENLKNLNGETSAGFVAVHVRRGDKITAREMEFVPLLKYYDAISLAFQQNPKIETVLFISDDDSIYPEFKEGLRTILEDNFATMYNIDDLLASQNALTSRGWDQRFLRDSDEAVVFQHTKDLIISLSIMAESDRAICTFSSNLGRIVQLLRTGPLDEVVSLDVDWDPL